MGSIPTSATRYMFMTEISLKRRKSLKRFTKKKKKKKKKNKKNGQIHVYDWNIVKAT